MEGGKHTEMDIIGTWREKKAFRLIQQREATKKGLM